MNDLDPSFGRAAGMGLKAKIKISGLKVKEVFGPVGPNTSFER
jgi:hypothetical protein